MDKKYIKMSTIKHRIEIILSAYDEQRTNSGAHETSACSSTSNSNSDTKNKTPFSYDTIDIESILHTIDKKSVNPVSTQGNRSKRRNAAKKRGSTTQSEIPKKKIEKKDEFPNRNTRSSARQRNLRKPVAKIPSIVIESDTDYDENNGEKFDAMKHN